MTSEAVIPHSLLTDFDTGLLGAGKHRKLYEKMGSHIAEVNGVQGTYFAVWAPNAVMVTVMGNFNAWNRSNHPLYARWDSSGVWEGFIPCMGEGEVYKYCIYTRTGQIIEKGDPFAIAWEVPPRTASVVRKFNYRWGDDEWMKNRASHNSLSAPWSVYEVHLGSWRRKYDENKRSFSYTELADELVPYVKRMGFTHVEFMPVMEHPFFGSWGYQITGYFAPTSRFGSPEDFARLVDAFHQAGIGVILDWVPSHFPGDVHGLFRFDGTALYEHQDHRLGYHPDWKSFIFNYGRNEVRAFLISNALYWFDVFHADAIRVDAVASMLYLDYSRKEGQWIPNRYGGRENLEAISLLKEINEAVYTQFPDVQTIAEESTAYPMISRPVSHGGLGFGMKWMMGWMNDMLQYCKENPIFRRFHHNKLTFSLVYAFTENFMLPLSHDEVVHGKGSLLSRMPGDEWQRFANLRALISWMYTHPGGKMLFMGSEFAQFSEWNHDDALLWNLLQFNYHSGMAEMVRELNEMLRAQPALYDHNFSPEGFEWIDMADTKNSVICFYRKGKQPHEQVVVAGCFTPNAIEAYSIGVNEDGEYEEIFNSDSLRFGGSDYVNLTPIKAETKPMHGRPFSITFRMPPLGFAVFKRKAKAPARKSAGAKTAATKAPTVKVTAKKTGPKKTQTAKPPQPDTRKKKAADKK
jgi:1,4-alpha-glucan branching enzyme